MSNGKLVAPNLDDRTWQDLVDDAKKRIPQYTPEWTDHHPSDLGITLIELFAWIAEQTIYRLNRIPEKNYIEFLSLLGISRDPPNPAQAEITFELGTDSLVKIPKGTQVATPVSGNEEGVIFETDTDFNAINLKACLLLDQDNHYKNLSATLFPLSDENYQAASLTIPANASRTLLLGLAGPTALELGITINLTSSRLPIGSEENPISWRYSTAGVPNEWETMATPPKLSLEKTQRVPIKIASTAWQRLAPADWGAIPVEGEEEVTDSLCWITLELPNPDSQNDLELELVCVAGNIPTATNALTIREEEPLGTSSGGPFQIYNLRNTPLHTGGANGLDHLIIAVRESGADWEVWDCVAEFNEEANQKEYLCNPVTGEITFGKGTPEKPGMGRIPPAGAEIKAVSYRYVAGESNANVPADTITVLRSQVAGVIGVTNETTAHGGTDWENLEDTKRRAPQEIRSRHRVVTVQDCEFLAKEANTEVHSARCFSPKKHPHPPPEWLDYPFERKPGQFNLIIVPRDIVSRQPRPTERLINEVYEYLNKRRILTSELVRPRSNSPYYVEVKVSAEVYIRPGLSSSAMKTMMQNKLYDFFQPVTGGVEGNGWQIGQHLYIPNVFQMLDDMEEISYVSNLGITGVNEKGEMLETIGVRLPIEDYQIICASEINDENYNLDVKEDILTSAFGGSNG